MSKISIVIPVLNEEKFIGKLLHHIDANSNSSNISDIIVVDGGSTDKTKDVVACFADVQLLNSEKGRAKQMNLGAKASNGEVLYFLHADALPPKNFDIFIFLSQRDTFFKYWKRVFAFISHSACKY